MRFSSTIAALAGAVMMTGCASNSLISLDPLVAEGDTITDSRLVGTWFNAATGKEKDGPSVIIVARDEEGSGYNIGYGDLGGTLHSLKAAAFKAGDAELLDITGDEDDFTLAVHVPVRVWFEGSQIKWAFLNSEWMRGRTAQLLAPRPMGKRLLTSASTEQLRNFLIQNAADERAHGEVQTYQKLQ